MTRLGNRLRSTATALLSRRQPAGEERGLRILHLAFEDHRQPGGGGGGLRSEQINRRLAARHRITVVTRRYPGARRRLESGVEYRHLGLALPRLGRLGDRLSYHLSIITYHLGIPWFLLTRRRADLVVEDFAAPVSSALVPLWTTRPTIAVVQWLFARETSRQYRVPFFLAEEAGIRLHRRFVAVSGYVADRLRATNPGARVDVVHAGVEPPVGGHERPLRGDLVFLGRIQYEAKGLDLALEALAHLADTDVTLVVAGDGPDLGRVEERAGALGLGDRVVCRGRVEGAEKWDLLAGAQALVLPSRYETFGLAALEALAVGTPVVGFAIPALAEIVRPGCGHLVPPFDAGALAGACRGVLVDPEHRRALGKAARARAADFDWDRAARAQEQAYLAAAAERGSRRPRRGLRPSPSEFVPQEGP